MKILKAFTAAITKTANSAYGKKTIISKRLVLS